MSKNCSPSCLTRVREILDADTAAVLLLDEKAGVLEARAASGIEEEVRQGVRVPLGAGFAGRIAATRDVVRLDRVDATTVANPILWERGVNVMLGVPLLRSDTVLGVLHVGRLEKRPFSDDDVELLRVVSDRVSAAVETRQHAIERAAAGLLERSLLPTQLPRVAGLDFATRYVAAEERKSRRRLVRPFHVAVGPTLGRGWRCRWSWSASSGRDGTHPQCATRVLDDRRVA